MSPTICERCGELEAEDGFAFCELCDEIEHGAQYIQELTKRAETAERLVKLAAEWEQTLQMTERCCDVISR